MGETWRYGPRWACLVCGNSPQHGPLVFENPIAAAEHAKTPGYHFLVAEVNLVPHGHGAHR